MKKNHGETVTIPFRINSCTISSNRSFSLDFSRNATICSASPIFSIMVNSSMLTSPKSAAILMIFDGIRFVIIMSPVIWTGIFFFRATCRHRGDVSIRETKRGINDFSLNDRFLNAVTAAMKS